MTFQFHVSSRLVSPPIAYSLRRMASATPDQRLHSQQQSIIAFSPLPNYTAWYRGTCLWNYLSRVAAWAIARPSGVEPGSCWSQVHRTTLPIYPICRCQHKLHSDLRLSNAKLAVSDSAQRMGLLLGIYYNRNTLPLWKYPILSRILTFNYEFAWWEVRCEIT